MEVQMHPHDTPSCEHCDSPIPPRDFIDSFFDPLPRFCSWSCYHDAMTERAAEKMEERFWVKVDATGDCWLWTRKLNEWGYGTFWYADRTLLAHRVAYMLMYGDIPQGLHVL